MIKSLPKSLVEAAKKILVESTHPMIDVDGNQKHRHNSEGAPIHSTDDGIRNFHRWFGDSKAVDEHGRPLVVYHGTNAHIYTGGEIHSFHTSPESGRGAAFFSSNKDIANQYGVKVYHTYLKTSNPLIVHGNGQHWSNLSTETPISGNVTDILRNKVKKNADELNAMYKELAGDEDDGKEIPPKIRDNQKTLDGHSLSVIDSGSETDDIAKTARKLGYDSVIFHNIKDSPTNDTHMYNPVVASIYSVFHPSQIKSATGNNGNFHPELNSINESTLTESKEPRLPFADISHHHHRKHLNEGKIEDWVNHKQPYDQQVNNFNFDTSIDSIRPKTYAAEDTHKDLADDHLSNLDGHHREAVESYIMGGLEDGDETGSFRVNDHLIKSHRAKKEPKKEFHFGSDEDFQRYLNLDHLDEALEINKLDKPMTTYSGIGFNPKDIMKDGNMLHLPAYTSSSTNRGVAVLYAKPDKDRVYHVMQIHHPTGSSGLYIGDRDDFSPFMQKEHIMPRNTTLKINPKPEVHTDNLGVQMHIWKATRVNTEDTK